MEKEELIKYLDKELDSTRGGWKSNLLIEGSSDEVKKIIDEWVEGKDVNLFHVDARDPNLKIAFYGTWVRVPGKNEITRAYPETLDKLDRKNSILFVSEYDDDQVDESVRDAIGKLTKDEFSYNHNYSGGAREFPNLLIVIAQVNSKHNLDYRNRMCFTSHINMNEENK